MPPSSNKPQRNSMDLRAEFRAEGVVYLKVARRTCSSSQENPRRSAGALATGSPSAKNIHACQPELCRFLPYRLSRQRSPQAQDGAGGAEIDSAMRAFPSVISKILLGSNPHQLMRVSQAMLVLAVYVVFAGVQHLEVLLGMIDASQSWVLTAWNLGGGISFYACIRSNLNLKLKKGRSLAIPQSIWAMVGITWSYAITGPARGAVILIMILVVVFTMFELTPSKARAVAAGAFAMLGTVMMWKAVTDPTRYDPRVEGMHLLFSGIVLAAASILAVRIGKLRARLQAQRTELADAIERIRALATRDDLTGLANRRAAIERMRDELAVRGRPEPLMSLALMDIDHFKLINDGHGHAVGDAVLRRFGECAQEAVRLGDMLARWGGEEFLLVMPATAPTQAMAAMERVREMLRQTSFADLAPGLVVTFSAGVAECVSTLDLEAAIARADAAMYEAKHAGRDRVVAAARASRPDCKPVVAECPVADVGLVAGMGG
jgi:diguanylate cyclase